MIGLLVSELLRSLGQAEVAAQRRDRDSILRALVGRLADAASLPAALTAAEGDWLGLMNATGALARVSGAYFRLGRLPPVARAESAFAALHSAANGQVLAVDDLGLRYPELADCAADGSGVLLLPLEAGGDDAIAWFRPEWARDIVWGGNPNEPATLDPVTGQLNPRASFATWKSVVRGRSKRWTEADLEIAREVCIAVEAEASKRTRVALREAETRFQLLAENSGDIIALCDIDGTPRYVSPAAERMLGWRADELMGRNGVDFVHPDDQHVWKNALEALQSGAPEATAYYRHQRADGAWLWVEGRARLRATAENQRSTGYVLVMRDATQAKEDERKLKDALERVERLAATDELTGLANRRRLREVAEQKWRRCAREHAPLSVAGRRSLQAFQRSLRPPRRRPVPAHDRRPDRRHRAAAERPRGALRR
jgi:PAS domain S-box-containing protein